MSSPSKLEKECNLSTVSAEGYKLCMDNNHLPVYKLSRIRINPNQAMNRAVSLLLVLLFLHYIKVITLPFKFIPQMK